MQTDIESSRVTVTNGKSRGYLSYLLRLWRTGKGIESTWRASLISPLTGERRGFGNLKDLFEFLQAQVDARASETSETDAESVPREDQ